MAFSILSTVSERRATFDYFLTMNVLAMTTLGRGVSEHFKRFRDTLNITERMDFHSLRHNVEDALRNADVRKEVRDSIQGHGENGVGAEYGTGYDVETLNDAVQKIGTPG